MQWLSLVTFGITHFDRPEHLARLIDSIRAAYPAARIVVADNSILARPQVPAGVELIQCPPDCGLSACRNALVVNLSTRFLLVLEEDFVFTEETDVEKLFDILAANPSIGVVGGSLYCDGSLHHYATRIVDEGEKIRTENAASKFQVCGETVWRLCDQVFNFFLARAECLVCNPWDESLKIGGEHIRWFHALKLQKKWLVAHTPQVRALHDMTGRSDHYQQHRNRAFANVGKDSNVLPYSGLWYNVAAKPNIILLGVGHSGTTIAARMLVQLGWHVANDDKRFCEDAEARSFNERIIAGQYFPSHSIAKYLGSIHDRPWLIKDPRHVVTLPKWYAALCKEKTPPLLVGITKRFDGVVASYLRRGENVEAFPECGGRSIAQLCELYRKRFDSWPWSKIEISYEQLAAAAALFVPRAYAAETSAT